MNETPNEIDPIEQAKEALVAAITANSVEVRCDGAFPTIIPTAEIDALIAAVSVRVRRDAWNAYLNPTAIPTEKP